MKTSEKSFLRDVWRQAYLKPDGLTIGFKSKSGAIRARLQLYNAIKGVRDKQEMDVDLALIHAAESLEIVQVNDLTLRLQRRSENDAMQGLALAMGKGPEAYEHEESDAALASLARITEGLRSDQRAAVEGLLKPSGEPEDKPAHKDNPFYGKRG